MDSTELVPAQTSAPATKQCQEEQIVSRFATLVNREKADMDYKLQSFERKQKNLEDHQMKLFSRIADDQRNFQKEIQTIERTNSNQWLGQTKVNSQVKKDIKAIGIETTSLRHKIELNEVKQTQMVNESKLTFNHKLEMLHQLQQQKMQDLAALEEIRSLKLENKLEISLAQQQHMEKQLNTTIENEKLNREKQMDMTLEMLRQKMQCIEATFKLRLDNLKLYLETKMNMSNLHQQQMAKEINAVLHDKTSSVQSKVEITQQPQQDMAKDQLQLKEQLISITDAQCGLRDEVNISLRNYTEPLNANITKLDADIRALENGISIIMQQQERMVMDISKLENVSQEQKESMGEELNILTSTIIELKSENVRMKQRFNLKLNVSIACVVLFIAILYYLTRSPTKIK